MLQKFERFIRSVFKLQEGEFISSLKELRVVLLNGVLRGIFIFWLMALAGGIYNVISAYREAGGLIENSTTVLVFTISLYVLSTAVFAVITFNQKLNFELRTVLFLLSLYILGTIGMVQTSFSGDGRILLFAFVIFSAIFRDFRSGLAAFLIALITLAVIGYLQVNAIVIVPVDWQVNSNLPGAWVSGGSVLTLFSLAAFISVTYLLQALGGSLMETRKALQREKHLSQILRTVSEVNQLITRAKERASLLDEVCKLLIHGRGYGFAWIGLMKPDGSTLELAAYAGGISDTREFIFDARSGREYPACLDIVIRTNKLVHVTPSDENDPCLGCPRRLTHPLRSAVSLPLLHHGRFLGSLVVEYDDQSMVFDQQEIALLQGLADNLAYALENIEAADKLSVYASHQRFLNEVTQTALSTLNIEPLLEEFIRKLMDVLEADGYYFGLWDDTRNLPIDYVSSDNYRSVLENFPTIKEGDKLFSHSVLEAGHVLAVPDVTDTPYISPHLVPFYEIRSVLGLPLIANQQKLGALIFGYTASHAFTVDELELAEQASHQFALTILKVKLNEETLAKAAELEKLYASARDMASSMLNPAALLVVLARHMTEAMGVTSTNITSFNHDTNRMKVEAEYWGAEASPSEMHSDLGTEYTYDDYATVMAVMMNGDTYFVDDNDLKITEAEREQFTNYGIKCMLFVPIMARGQLFGTIEIWESRRYREFTEAEKRLALSMASHAASVIENARLYERLEQREAHFRALIENSAEGVAILDINGIVRYITPSEERLTGYKAQDIVGTSAFTYMHSEDLPRLKEVFAKGISTPEMIQTTQYRIRRKDGQWRHFEVTGRNMLDDPYIAGVVVNYRDITERVIAEKKLLDNEARLEKIINTALNGIITIDSERNIVLFNPFAENIFGYKAEQILGKPLDILIPDKYRATHDYNVENYGKTNISRRIHGRTDDLYGLKANGDEFPMEAYVSQQIIGDQKYFTVILRDITERKLAEDEQRRRSEELQTLAFISSALRTALNVDEIIPLVIRHAVNIVSGHYGTIYLLEKNSDALVSPGWYSISTGEDIRFPDEPLLRNLAGKGITGFVARTGEMYIAEDLQSDPLVTILPNEEGILRNAHSAISLPLLSREKVIGVLHICLTSYRQFTEEEIRLLTAIAEMAGSALLRATLYEQTLQQAKELALAYDNTLSGWARALEMRDELTEGHTRRVTELTIELARHMKISEYDIVQIRRGAILHDIGKMGIPDSILNKAGPLTAHEIRIMQMHPQYAYEMLSFIPFLQPALDIPYCHHEWWNGNGYPRGLKGESIPLSARIFSVVDVWDALTSDRPYRSAWSQEKTLKYIQDGSGKQFDPNIVDVFLHLIQKQ